MADERFVVMTVECQHCKTKQAIHVAAKPGFAQMANQTISCINCRKDFDVMVPDKSSAARSPISSVQTPPRTNTVYNPESEHHETIGWRAGLSST